MFDCPGKEDEAECRDAACPGFYRCRGSFVCLHPTHLCDGSPQCPQRDDELVCDLKCPAKCTCHGLAFVCAHSFLAHRHPELRYLDASASGMMPNQLRMNTLLIYLNLAGCELSSISDLNFPNVLILDLSENVLSEITTAHFMDMKNLRNIILAKNPLKSLFIRELRSNPTMPNVLSLDLSDVRMDQLDFGLLSPFENLRMLNLSGSGVNHAVSMPGFQTLLQLQVLDLRGCVLSEFPRDLFRTMAKLRYLHSDNYKVCCSAILPVHINPRNCRAPSNDISSCADLLRSNVNRMFLAIFAALALIGNLGSLFVRMRIHMSGKASAYGAFVIHLCISDWLMGVYLAIIGVADSVYRNAYLWEDEAWRHSVTCKLAGFLALLSSEVSAFVICLITLDRFLVIRYPFSRLHFQHVSAEWTCCTVWLVGVLLASIPLFPATSSWQFFGQTGICIPLPITRKVFPGHGYAFGVMIVLNMVLFVLIAVGQTVIYKSIKANTMTTADCSRKQQNVTIARRLITIAITDFLCWFPVGVMGLLATAGVAVPGGARVTIATFVMPLNSAINPFIYTVNVILEQRRRDKEQKLLTWFKTQPK